MFVRYFLYRFFIIFSLALAGLIPLFATSDLVVRLASVPFSFQILKLFGFMLPMVCLFAFPIAACLAIGLVVGQVFTRGEAVNFRFFPLARHAIEKAVLLFSIVFFLLYVPFLFWWAPQGYWAGKRFLINAAQQQIENLPAKKFHSVASRGTIFFKEKSLDRDGSTKFHDLLLMVREKDEKQYLVTSREGLLKQGFLYLYDGTIYNNALKKHSVATFEELEIAFEKLFFQKTGMGRRHVKFMTWEELREGNRGTPPWKELHKRSAQLIWQLLLPFLIFWAMMSIGRERSNLLLSVLVSGGFFLLSYISLNMAHYLLTGSSLSMGIFYMIPAGTTILTYLGYRRTWLI